MSREKTPPKYKQIADKLDPFGEWFLTHKFVLQNLADLFAVHPNTMRRALRRVNAEISPGTVIPSRPVGHDSREWSLIQNFVVNRGCQLWESADAIALDCSDYLDKLTAPVEVTAHCIVEACKAKQIDPPRILAAPRFLEFGY